MNWKQKHNKLRERVYRASGAKSISAFDKQVTRAAVGLTTEEALFVLADKYGVQESRGFAKLQSDSQQRVSNRIVQNVAVNTTNTTKNVKIDKRSLHITNSSVQNLAFGDRNDLSQNIVNIGKTLDGLVAQIDKCAKLTDDEKSDYKSDIQTIASQIGKSKPSRSIIKTAWESVKVLSEIEGFAQFIAHIASLIHVFIS
jgi:hypothetical protein